MPDVCLTGLPIAIIPNTAPSAKRAKNKAVMPPDENIVVRERMSQLNEMWEQLVPALTAAFDVSKPISRVQFMTYNK
jgi:hypothetical protein